MACITISGFPCSGKSTRADQLKAYLEKRLSSTDYTGDTLKVEVISDDILGLPRSSYDDSRVEKPTRSALFTTVTRLLNQNTIVIIDAMNYIKGFRYQIYCAAREARVRPCTVHVLATPDQCRARNLEREPSASYAPETFENLITRYEEPSSMVRWDSPLFAIPWDEDVPGDAIFAAVTSSVKKPPNQGVVAVYKPPTDALQTLETMSATIVNLVLAVQKNNGGGGPQALVVPLAPSPLRITVNLPHRNVTLSELQRIKRQFITIHKKAVTQGMAGKAELDWSEETVARKFALHLEEVLGS